MVASSRTAMRRADALSSRFAVDRVDDTPFGRAATLKTVPTNVATPATRAATLATRYDVDGVECAVSLGAVVSITTVATTSTMDADVYTAVHSH